MAWSPPPMHVGQEPVVLTEATPAQVLQVRAATHHDLPAICVIENLAYPFPWTRGNFSDSLHSGYDFWVLSDADGMAGHAVLMWSVEEVHLLNITVHPERQGRGHGRRFLRWLFSDAQARGARSMLLEVRPSNTLALGLYRTLGFEEIGLRKGYYPSWNNSREDALVFSRRIDHTVP